MRRIGISDEAILCHHLCISLPQFMESEFVLLANNMLGRILSYKSALVKCRPIIDENGTAAGEEIAKMSVEDINETVEDDKKGSSGDTQTTYASKFLKAISISCK